MDISTDFEVYFTVSDFSDDAKSSKVVLLFDVFEVRLVVGIVLVVDVLPSKFFSRLQKKSFREIYP